MHPVVFGLTGMGGYASWIVDQLLNHSLPARNSSASPITLAVVCEPDLHTHAATAQRLRDRGVKVVASIDELLCEPIDAVWLPLPIDLHRPFTEKCLRAGKAVLVEKPAAGCVDDVDAMIHARDGYRQPVAVGYQNLYDPATWAAKQRLLDGAIGKPISASVVGCWPRGAVYYARTSWAGKIKHNDAWVLDSPANNALAHFLNLALFLLGSTPSESATSLEVEAELYRANPIENYDTCCQRFTVEGNVKLLTAFTHACRNSIQPVITIRGERGELRFSSPTGFEITRTGKSSPRKETFAAVDHRAANVALGFADYIRGESTKIATLENARAHTLAINGASEASAVRTVPSDQVKEISGSDGHPMRTIPGIEGALAACANDGEMLHESARMPWSSPAGSKDLREYNHFAGPAPQRAPLANLPRLKIELMKPVFSTLAKPQTAP